MTQALRKYTPDEEKKVSIMMIYARIDSQLSPKFGDGFPYRLESLGNTDTTQSIAPLDYSQNSISFLRDMGAIIALKLKKEVTIIRQNFDENLLSIELKDWDMMI